MWTALVEAFEPILRDSPGSGKQGVRGERVGAAPPVATDCGFRRIPITDSDSFRSPIPTDSDQ